MESRYRKGTKPIPDSTWRVETIKDNKFIKVGKVFVKGADVQKAMREHRSIKGYTPFDLAKKKAREKYPEANPVILTEVM